MSDLAPGSGEESAPPPPPSLAPASAPPVLPPVLPAAGGPPPTASRETRETGLAGRLHPLTLLIGVVRTVRGFAIPAMIVLLTAKGGSMGAVLMGMFGLSVLHVLVKYGTFSYRVQQEELVTRQGLLSRQERHIPLRRVQDLRLEAGLLHRLLGVVDVRVETAGGQGVEAELSVLARADAEALRQAVFAGAGRASATEGAANETGEVLARLGLRELVIEGLTSNRAASALVLLGALLGFGDDFVPQARWESFMTQLGQGAERWIAREGSTRWQGIAAVTGGIVALSAVFSVAGSIVLFYGFSLVRRGEDLFRTYGLFTRRAASLPRRRIQLLQVEETWLRRWLGLAVVRVDTAARAVGGDEEKKGGRDVMVPLTRRAGLDRLLPRLLPELGPGPAFWEKVAPCAVKRATFRATVVCLLAGAVLGAGLLRSTDELSVQLQALWVLGLIPLAYWVNRRSYLHLGFADEGPVFRTRRGWVNRTTHAVPVRNLQVVVLHQTPLDRRHGVWTLKLDTAGQAYTGGGPLLRNMPAETAWTTGRSLARRAAGTRYRV